MTCITSVFGDTYVRGYNKKDGTYVAPHYRSSGNSTTIDNWSTKGNLNIYTGKTGTKEYSTPKSTYSLPKITIPKYIPTSTYSPPEITPISIH